MIITITVIYIPDSLYKSIELLALQTNAAPITLATFHLD